MVTLIILTELLVIKIRVSLLHKIKNNTYKKRLNYSYDKN